MLNTDNEAKDKNRQTMQIWERALFVFMLNIFNYFQLFVKFNSQIL